MCLPWALQHNSLFQPTQVFTRDINCIHLYGSYYNIIDPLKFGTWALTREWVLAQDTMVLDIT